MTDENDEPPNEINRLMDWITSDNVHLLKPVDIDKVIEYNRKSRANFEAGVKPKKGEKVEIDLVKLGMVKAPEPIKRRI